MSNYNSPRNWHFPTYGTSEEWNHAPRLFPEGGSWARPNFNVGPRLCATPQPIPCNRPRQHSHCHRPNVIPVPYVQPRRVLPPHPRQHGRPPPPHGWPPHHRNAAPRLQQRPGFPPPHYVGPPPNMCNGPVRPPEFLPQSAAAPFSEVQHSIPLVQPRHPRPMYNRPALRMTLRAFQQTSNVLPVPIANNYHCPPSDSKSYCGTNVTGEGAPCLRNIKIESVNNDYDSILPNPLATDYQLPANTSEGYYRGNGNLVEVLPCLGNIKLETGLDPVLPNPPANAYQFPVNTSESYYSGNSMGVEGSPYHHNAATLQCSNSVEHYNPVVPTSFGNEYQFPVSGPTMENNYSVNVDGRVGLPCLRNIKLENASDYSSQVPNPVSNDHHFPINSSENNARDDISLHQTIKVESSSNYNPLVPPPVQTTQDYQHPVSSTDDYSRFSNNNEASLPRRSIKHESHNNPTPSSSTSQNSSASRRDFKIKVEDSSWEKKRPLPKERPPADRSDRDFARPASRVREDQKDRSRSSSRGNGNGKDKSAVRERRPDSRSDTRPRSRNSSLRKDGGRKSPLARHSSRERRSRSHESTSSSRCSRSESFRKEKRKRDRSKTPERVSPERPRRRRERSRSASRRRSAERSTSRVPPPPPPKVAEAVPPPEVAGAGTTERENLLQKYRKNYCANSTDAMQSKLQELAKMTPDEVMEQEKKVWTRTAPAELFYERDPEHRNVVRAKRKLSDLCDTFRHELVERAGRARAARPPYIPPPRKDRSKMAVHRSEACGDSSGDSSGEDGSTDEEDCTMEEMERKRLHPHRLHQELWFNDAGEMNDGPLCRCSARARRCGIRHGIYAGERRPARCDIDSNNADTLRHYRITISPPTNFLTKTPTIVNHDQHEFIFEGFSMFSHFPLEKLPTCKVIRFNIEYTILYVEERIPENFTIRELDLFHDYLFKEILELVDLDFKAYGDSSGCSQFHFMPRFVRDLPDNGKEILSMNEVLQYLLDSNRELIQEPQLKDLLDMPQYKWQNFADEIKGMVVTYPGVKPCALRVDQLDRNHQGKKKRDVADWPEIVHFGIRPPQLSYAGNPDYQKAWREYVKYRHLIANMPKPSFEDKRKLEAKENKLQEMRTLSKMKRDVTVAVKSEGFFCTGIMCDVVQHAMLIPVLVCHLRFHRSCNVLEADIGYKFDNRYLLQLALTHPSYRENFGTNPDHARNSLTNCGIRQPEYGDRRIHYMNTRKRGINTLINIMSRFGKKTETESNITHNERLEFLGDAVVEFLTSIHLFHMFPDLEEGGLATYRAAIVQNQHLAVLAKRLKLEEFMLYAHGSDLCHDLELRHAMANCFEALMGALFLDGGIEVADKVFGETLFKEKTDLLDVWVNYPPHPLQEQEPLGDRKWIPHFELLQKLTEFEKTTNIEFTHIRLLARAFTDRSIGYTNLTLGSNQRLEFLGDTVLQLIASEYLYKFFPEHHEGHLSLLRSSLVNNRTQAVVCDDLAMTNYALYANPKGELKTKDRADLLEAFLGALYVDQDLEFCHVFCHVCFFPRLQDFIMNQDWNDPKSKLQQCCLTLRTMDGGEPDIPIYKVIECKGPTNTRVYTVAVYFQSRRLASASGHSIQQAEMNAAKKALDLSQELFPQLDHQKRVIAKSMKKQKWPNRSILRGRPTKPSTERERRQNLEEC